MAAPTRTEPMLWSALVALTLVSGVVDAASYLALGHVFTANMTGNVAVLGFAVARAQGLSVPRSLTALAAFFGGGVLGGRMAARMSAAPRHRWTGVAFGAEAVFFLAAMAVAIGGGSDLSKDPSRLYATIVLTALPMGLRNATVRKLGVPHMTTTVLTLTITGLAADSRLAGGTNEAWVTRSASVGAMASGAALGAWLLGRSLALVLALCAVVTAACAVAAFVGLSRAGRGTTPEAA